MPCGCMDGKSQVFVYVDPQGRETEYPKEIQAQVAKVRNGGAGTIKPRYK